MVLWLALNENWRFKMENPGEVVRLGKDAKFSIINQACGGAFDSLVVRDSAGNEGFIEIGTAIQKGVPGPPMDKPKTESEAALRTVGFGAIWLIVGVAVSAGTYSAASDSGGTYFVMWGPMAYGAWRILKGLVQLIGAD
jgi:hypothetical protein